MLDPAEKNETAPLAVRGPESPWISILIPVYNVAPYLRQCVESVIQNGADEGVEIVLLDDCSTDDSLAICRQLSEQYPSQVRLLQHSHNQGLSAARNHLLEQAEGEYIWFIDSDDYLINNAVQSLKIIIDRHFPDMVICDYRKRRSLFKKSFPGSGGKCETNRNDLISGVFRYRKMYAWLKIVRRSIWNDLQFPVGHCFEDIATTPHLLMRTSSYYYAASSWLYYRIRPGSIMSSVTRAENHFDIDKNRDMALALDGLADALCDKIGLVDPKLSYHVAHFIGKEYVKMAKRYGDAVRRGNLAVTQSGESINKTESYALLLSLMLQMQRASPMSFEALAQDYLRRGQFWNYLALTRAVKMANSQR
ncbi:MAG: glycosyltransferase family 2 protein [Sphingomonadales bacterium]|nr:glycosyltransferase family 2 protein [Sphingomonadales bacterium]